MMKKGKLLAVSSGLALLPLSVFAAPPTGVTLGQGTDWTLTGSTVNFTCPTGYTCSANPVSDAGFYQVQLTDGSGNSYYRTIVATAATGESFQTDSIVIAGSTNGGISAVQSLSATAGSGTLNSGSTINTGSFLPDPTAEDSVTLTQNVSDATGEFNGSFNFGKRLADLDGVGGVDDSVTTMTLGQSNVPGNGEFTDSFDLTLGKEILATGVETITSKSIAVRSGVRINAGGTTNDQTFRYDLLQGDAVTAAASATLQGPTGGTVNWVAADTIEQVLVNQVVTNVGDFGYQRVGNQTTATETTEFSLAGVGPFASFGGAGDPFPAQ